ncbi:MAG: hydrogenase maturation protease [Candidatus Aminicenantaceae bacterium]
MKTLILGLGNELYGDDGVGLHVVRRLKRELKEKKNSSPLFKNVDLEECSLSGLSLLDVIVGYDRLIIIDTIKKMNPATGRVHLLEEKDLRHIPGPSPHYVSVPQTLKIGKKMGLKVPSKIRIVAAEAKNLYNLGEGLSEEMTEALPAILQKVKEVLKII